MFASGKRLFTEANTHLLQVSRGEICSERVWLEGLFSNPYIYSKFDNPIVKILKSGLCLVSVEVRFEAGFTCNPTRVRV